MKSIMQNLFFDQTLVNQIRELKVPEGVLYMQLVSGKITLKEYLRLI